MLLKMTARVSTNGQIILPSELRWRDCIRPGQEFEVQRIGAGEYLMIRRKLPANQGLVDWLLACHEKGFFVPIQQRSKLVLDDFASSSCR